MATTIKVPVALRDRIDRDVQERGVTAAGFIQGLVDGYERRRRAESFGRAFRGDAVNHTRPGRPRIATMTRP